MMISIQIHMDRPVPNENRAHRPAPARAIHTRLERSARWAIGTVSIRATAPAMATIDKMPVLSRWKLSRISGRSRVKALRSSSSAMLRPKRISSG